MRLPDKHKKTAINIDSLLEHTQSTFGKTITTNFDCCNLADEIFRTTDFLISAQTLRRVFRLIQSKTGASRYTIEVLCRYCGYQSLDQFFFYTENASMNPARINEATIYKDFFDVETLPISRQALNSTYRKAVKNILKHLYSDRDLYNLVVPMLADNRTAQNYLFEQFPYIDGLGRGFAAGYNFYLQRKLEPEAQCFGNAILFLSAALQNDQTGLDTYLNAINSIPLAEIHHPFCRARYIGSNLLYHYMNGDQQALSTWMQMALSDLTGNPNAFGFQSESLEYERMIAIYLTLCDCHEMVITVLSPVWKRVSMSPMDLEYGYWLSPIKIMLFKSHVYCGRTKEALAILPNYEPVDWMLEDYYRIQYLDARLKITDVKSEKDIKSERKALQKDLSRLISKTNFLFFNKLLR
jgi:hypothetical protein